MRQINQRFICLCDVETCIGNKFYNVLHVLRRRNEKLILCSLYSPPSRGPSRFFLFVYDRDLGISFRACNIDYILNRAFFYTTKRQAYYFLLRAIIFVYIAVCLGIFRNLFSLAACIPVCCTVNYGPSVLS